MLYQGGLLFPLMLQRDSLALPLLANLAMSNPLSRPCPEGELANLLSPIYKKRDGKFKPHTTLRPSLFNTKNPVGESVEPAG